MEKIYEVTEANQRMIDWLSVRSPDVWHYIAFMLNWDDAEAALEWIVDQDDADQATISSLFWLAEPDYFLKFSSIKEIENWQINDFRFIKKIIDNWTEGKYKRSELRGEIIYSENSSYLVARENLRRRKLPFATPDSIMNEFYGREPEVNFKDRTENSVELRELLMDLGTMTAGAEKIEQAKNRKLDP